MSTSTRRPYARLITDQGAMLHGSTDAELGAIAAADSVHAAATKADALAVLAWRAEGVAAELNGEPSASRSRFLVHTDGVRTGAGLTADQAAAAIVAALPTVPLRVALEAVTALGLGYRFSIEAGAAIVTPDRDADPERDRIEADAAQYRRENGSASAADWAAAATPEAPVLDTLCETRGEAHQGLHARTLSCTGAVRHTGEALAAVQRVEARYAVSIADELHTSLTHTQARRFLATGGLDVYAADQALRAADQGRRVPLIVGGAPTWVETTEHYLARVAR